MGRSRGRGPENRAEAGKAAVLAAPMRSASADAASQTWYVAEGKRGQQLLDQGQLGPAVEVFESVLARLGEAPSYARAVILGRLARCFQLGARADIAVTQLREAIDSLGRVPPSDGVKALRGTLRSELGDAFRAQGRLADARKTYEAALRIAEELRDLRSQCVDLGHLGSLALEEGRVEEGLARYQAALRIVQGLDEPALEAVAWYQLGRAHHAAGQAEEAERHYKEAARISEDQRDLRGVEQSCRQLALLSIEAGNVEATENWSRKAIDLVRGLGDREGLTRQLAQLAAVLLNSPARLAEARQLAEEALATTQSVNPAGPLAWSCYGVLAAIDEKEAEGVDDSTAKAALQSQARDYRQIEQYAPRFLATLVQIGEVPSHGRAVLLGRLGRSFQLGGRPEFAVAPLREAVDVVSQLGAGEVAKGLHCALSGDLGDALCALGRYDDARTAYESSLVSARDLRDLQGQAIAARRLGALATVGGNTEEAELRQQQAAEIDATLAGTSPAAGPTSAVTLYDDVATEYAFPGDLLIDGVPERRVSGWTGQSALPDGVRPMLAPGVRTWMDQQQSVRFSIPPGEPAVDTDPGCTVIRRTRRELAVSEPGLVWRLVEQIDGARSAAEILERISSGDRDAAGHLLAALAATGAVDISGRTVGRFVHAATKKGVLPAGGLGEDEVLRLATDGEYRSYPEAARVNIAQTIPGRLRPFHSLTRSRRSHRDYTGQGVRRDEFDALLDTACGVTGSMPWSEREVKLRAYPSSGALYAVEIYPIVFQVEGLTPAVYHYRAVESILELVRPIEPHQVVQAALPVEREMLAGAAALVCLVGSFPRHERKYGQGGYRMLVAEAGHISQNLVLTATGLGLSARPFGGVFDVLLNQELGLQGADEQFLLAVLVGHAEGPLS